MTEWLMRIQTDTIVVQVLVEEIDSCPYRIAGNAFLLNCTFFVSTELIRSESSAPQLCPMLGCPVWPGQNQEVEQRLGY